MAVYEALLLNTVVPQIQAAQAGDSYVMVVNATTPALRITQTGTGDAILVEDETNPDSSPFVVTAAGTVGVGTSSVFGVLNLQTSTNARIEFTSGSTAGSLEVLNNARNAYLDYDVYASTHRWRKLGSIAMTLDSSGNLGLGVTPSAWGTGWIASQISGGGSAIAGRSTNPELYITANAHYNGSNWIYKTSNFASYYALDGKDHKWYQANSGTAGSTISFTQAMTLDASGNLVLGNTSVTSGMRLDVQGGDFRVGDDANQGFEAGYSAGGSQAFIQGYNRGTSAFIDLAVTGSNIKFLSGSSPAERARITSGGYFKASNTGTYIGAGDPIHELVTNNETNGIVVLESTNASYSSTAAVFIGAARNTTNNSFYAIGYYNRGAAAYKFRVADSGDVTNTNGTYGTISDQKMKTDIVDAGSQWGDIKALRFRKFKMKDDPSGLVQLGVVAQEVELTSPGLVDEHIDRDAEGNDLGTTTKSVKTSVLLMKAAVALQEAMARIETLEAKIAALEAK